MGRRSHDAVRLERTKSIDNALIVGRDDGFPHEFALLDLFHHVLNEGFSGLRGDNFCGEAGRPVSGGNDNGCSQESILISRFLVGSELRGESSERMAACQIWE
jgi:hypothetical protein